MFDKIDTLNFHNKDIQFYVSNKTTTARVKKIWKKEREYEQFVESLSDEERATLSPDEIKLKLSQIHTWSDGDDKYKNNV